MNTLHGLACLTLICALLGGSCHVDATNPGFKARITSKGLKYANNAAIEALKKNVQKATIPNQSGKSGAFKYDITNIHVTKFNPPSSSISLAPGKGLSWKAANAEIDIHGDFHYKALFVSDGGSFDAKLSGISFGVEFDIGKDSTGRPTISSANCVNGIGGVDFKFHGGMAWLYNLFRGKVGNMIKDSLHDQLCKFINQEINVDGKKKLADLKVTTKLGQKFLLDYRFLATPTFNSSFMETYHKGEIFWLADASKDCPLTPPPMPDTTDNQSMMYLWISDYMFDSIGYVAQQHGFLVRNLTQNDLPAGSKGVLNTTCSGIIPKCVGGLIPQIGKKYPNMAVELRMSSNSVPRMTVSSAGVSLSASGTINMFATKPGSSTAPFLISLGAVASTNAKISIHDELVFGEVQNLSVKLKVLKSDVGTISETFLDFLVKEALNVVLVPQLNELGKKGFPLPMTDEIKFVNTKLSFAKDTILIGTDLQYTPKGEAPIDIVTGPLKYIPRQNLL